VDAVSYLHDKGYAHRDIKLENILLDINFKIKLADFGYVTLIWNEDGRNRILKKSVGTSGYAAPEIYKR